MNTNNLDELITEKLGILPNSLPYRVVEKKAEFSEVPDELRHKIKFEVYQVSSSLLGSIPASSPDFSVTISMPELAGKRITLSYIPATQDDAALIEEYGGITNVPAYLVEMKPVLRVEGEPLAVGSPVTLGETQQFVMEFITPGGERDRVVNDVTVGAYYAVGLNVGKVPQRLIEKRIANLKVIRYLIGKVNVSLDSILGEQLYAVAMSYFLELDMFNDIFAKTTDIVWFRQPSEIITSTGLSVDYLFWSPYMVDITGYNIDVDRNVYVTFSKDGDGLKTIVFMQSAGVMGSAMEHYVLEQAYNISSVSAVKIINIANEQGIPIYEINKDNVNDILPKLQVSDEVKAAIKNSVNSGMEVTIPQREIQYINWTGIGWIVLDPKSGAGAYMISGGLAGGGTADEKRMEGEKIFIEMLYTVASQNYDPTLPEAYYVGVAIDLAVQEIIKNGIEDKIWLLQGILDGVVRKINEMYMKGKIGSLEFSYFMLIADIAQMFLNAAGSFQLGYAGLLVKAAFYRGALEITDFLADFLVGYRGAGV